MILTMMSLAWGDAIGMFDVDCPPGSEVTFKHIGHWCAPVPCTETCPSNDCIADVGLCINVTTEPCGRRSSAEEPCTWEKTEALGLCSTDADCATGSCIREDRCVSDAGQKILAAQRAEPAASTPSTTDQKRCSATSVTSTGLGLALLLAAVARRRQ